MSNCPAGVFLFESGILSLVKHTCEEKQLAAMQTIYTGKGVIQEMNLREHISCICLQHKCVNEGAHFGFKFQRRHHQKSEIEVPVAPKINMCLPKKDINNTCMYDYRKI